MKLSIFNLHRSSPESAKAIESGQPVPGLRPGEGQVADKNGLPGYASLPVQDLDLDVQPPPNLQELRLRILNNLCIAASILGLVVFIVNLPLQVAEPSPAQWAALIAYSLAVAVVLAITIARRLPYNMRAAILMAVLLAVGAGALVADGLYGSGRVYLIVLPFLAVILLGRRGRVGSLILSIAIVAITGALMITGILPAPTLRPGTENNNLLSWIVATANFTLLALAGVISITALLRGLEENWHQQQALTEELAEERKRLEDHIQKRTSDLEYRLLQIRTAAEITRYISRVLDIHTLLPQVCELVQGRFNLYYVGVFLVEEPYAVLVAGTGVAGQRMLAEGHRLLIGGDSMIGWAIANRQARIALDVGKEATRFNNPHLPGTRSELALPILVGSGGPGAQKTAPGSSLAGRPGTMAPSAAAGQALGAMTIQSEAEAAFDQDDIVVLQSIADGLASAIENARLFAATQANLDEIQKLHRQYLERAWAHELDTTGALGYTYAASETAEPSEATPLAEESSPSSSQRTLEVPLRLRDQVIGILTLEFAEDGAQDTAGLTPAEETALVEAVAAQAALALENARLLEETRRTATQDRIAANISSQVWASTDIETILRTALQEVGSALNVKDGWIELQLEEAH